MAEGGEGRGERGRVAKVTKDPQVRTLQQFVRAETEKSQATPAQKSQVTPDRSHKRPLYRRAAASRVSFVCLPVACLAVQGLRSHCCMRIRPIDAGCTYRFLGLTENPLARAAGHNTSLAQCSIHLVLTYATRLGRGHFPGCHAHARAVIPSFSPATEPDVLRCFHPPYPTLVVWCRLKLFLLLPRLLLHRARKARQRWKSAGTLVRGT